MTLGRERGMLANEHELIIFFPVFKVGTIIMAEPSSRISSHRDLPHRRAFHRQYSA